MKGLFLVILFMLFNLPLIACPVCDQQQPKLLSGITHGQGPDSNWDYLIIFTIGAIVLMTLWFSVKWLLNPGEKSADHIKQLILKNS
tara:strand:- start:431 stop:691 length:261 start_codon:yes stop_codon:yes gene_type:complete